MLVAELAMGLQTLFPAQNAEAWDHIGLSVGDPAQEVDGVACALDATVRTLDSAAKMGANVLLSHHPVYITPPPAFVPAASAHPSAAGTIYEAISRNMSIISLHTNLDRSMAARAALPDKMGLTARSSLEFPDDPQRVGMGSICDVAQCSLQSLAREAAAAFDTHPQVWGDPFALVQRIAFLGGSLSDMGELALRAGCDAVITGELGYHRAQDLMLRGLSVILLGHDRSEQPFCRILADAAARTGIAWEHIHIISLPRQWWVPSQGGHA